MVTLGTAAKKDTTDCIYNEYGRQWSSWLAAVCWHMGQIKNSGRFTSDMNHTNPQLKCKLLQTFWIKIEIYSLLSLSCLSLRCSSCTFALLPFTVCAQTSSHGDLKKTLRRLSAHSFSSVPPRLGGETLQMEDLGLDLFLLITSTIWKCHRTKPSHRNVDNCLKPKIGQQACC